MNSDWCEIDECLVSQILFRHFTPKDIIAVKSSGSHLPQKYMMYHNIIDNIHGLSVRFLLMLTEGAPFTVATVSFISILSLDDHAIYKPTTTCYFLTTSLTINLTTRNSLELMD